VAGDQLQRGQTVVTHSVSRLHLVHFTLGISKKNKSILYLSFTLKRNRITNYVLQNELNSL